MNQKDQHTFAMTNTQAMKGKSNINDMRECTLQQRLQQILPQNDSAFTAFMQKAAY